MSYHPVDDPDVSRPWFMKKTVWIIGAVVFLVLTAGTISLIIVGMRKVPEIGGEVTIETDPDTRIYIGDKLVGTTQVSFTWEEFFGDEKHDAMAVELPVGPPLTPNALVEPGSTILEMQSLSGGGSGVSGLMITGSGHTCLLRRADGQLDQVAAIVIDWAQANQPPRRFLLPVRLRKGKGESTVFFSQSGSGSSTRGGPGATKLFGQSPIEVKRSYRFSAGSPPIKFAEEIKSKGLWEPGGK
jgi:hypothetical protein